MGLQPQDASRSTHAPLLEELLEAVNKLIIPYVEKADERSSRTADELDQAALTRLEQNRQPASLAVKLQLYTPKEGTGKLGLLSAIQGVLEGSVNTWDQGFMDKLYASTNPVGVISELVLAVLNTNVHVYQVSPSLTLVEKHVTKALARLFGLSEKYAGGVSQPGGSASNATSILVARNTLYPDTKTMGLQGRRFVLFTSAHGHYSLQKAAQIMGFGSDACRAIGTDEHGRMIPMELQKAIMVSRATGETPFYVNATAGTTVLGSYDPVEAIADICRRHRLWLHVDASWGGSVIFSDSESRGRLDGVHLADSITVNPHKMLGIPVTCSFLLGRDMREFQRASTTDAGYLFHGDADRDTDTFDLADYTPQCGRKGDSLKMYLAWVYFGSGGFQARVERAFQRARQLFRLLEHCEDILLVTRWPVPCLQICFYCGPARNTLPTNNTRRTKALVSRLSRRGFMVDFAPGEYGHFLRVVVNGETLSSTIESLANCIQLESSKIFVDESTSIHTDGSEHDHVHG